MHFEVVFVLLFSVAAAVALAARRLRVPYTVALVLAGLGLGTAHAFEPPHLTKDLLYAVFLPGLIFEAAFHLDVRKYWDNKLAIHSLAVPGVAAAIALTAFLLTPVAQGLHFVDGFELRHGLVFAAVVAATDPIAVVGLFRSLGAPKRLAVLLEGESLLNDGTAVVFFGIILGFAAGGGGSVAAAALEFLKVVGVGSAIGLAFGYIASKVIQQVDDPMIEITLTTIAAYGSFVAAEHFGYSGVIATVAAGMLCGNYGARTGMSPSTRVAVETFWEYVAFALNSFVFLLIGFEVKVEALVASWRPILVAWLAVTVARVVVIFTVSALLRFTRERVPWSWSAVLTWGGLRGGLSMVLVLGLDPAFPHRDLLVTMTFGVVIVSILVQGVTMAPLLRRFGLVATAEDRVRYEVGRGAARATGAALSALEDLARDGLVHRDVIAALRGEYAERLETAEAAMRELHLRAAALRAEETQIARRHLLLAEKQAVLDAFHKGLIGQEALEQLGKAIDARLVNLEIAGESPPPPEAPPSRDAAGA